MYKVVSWDTQKVMYTFEKLATAKRYARGAGHTGEDNPGLRGYPPIAYVQDAEQEYFRAKTPFFNPHRRQKRRRHKQQNNS